MSVMSSKDNISAMSSKRGASEETVTMDFDDLLDFVGFGKWQMFIYLLPIFAMILFPMQLLGTSFLNAPVPFRCSSGPREVSLCRENNENCTQKNPSELAGNESYYNSQCLLFLPSLHDQSENNNDFLPANMKRTALASCPYIEYDTSVFTSTVVSQFDLVCEQSYLRPLFASVGTMGCIFGAIIAGCTADKYGRSIVIKLSIIFYTAVVVIMALSDNFVVVMASRFLSGSSVLSVVTVTFNSAMESTLRKHRSLAGMLLGLPFGITLAALSGISYLTRSWNYLLLVGTAPVLVPLVSSFLTPESPRWLLQKGKVEEAKKILLWAAKINGTGEGTNLGMHIDDAISIVRREMSVDAPIEQSTLQSLKNSFSSLWSTGMRRIIICFGISWIFQNIIYVGVGLSAHNFTDDPFLYGALAGSMDTLSLLLLAPFISSFGRRFLLMVVLSVSGVLFLLELSVPSDVEWLRLVLVMTGFLLIAGSLQINFVYAPELFPTEMRARGFAYGQVLGNIGCSVSPFITDMLSEVVWWGPSVAFGSSAIIASMVIPFLPETRNRPLLDTMQDVEERHRRQKQSKNAKGIGEVNLAYVNDECTKL